MNPSLYSVVVGHDERLPETINLMSTLVLMYFDDEAELDDRNAFRECNARLMKAFARMREILEHGSIDCDDGDAVTVSVLHFAKRMDGSVFLEELIKEGRDTTDIEVHDDGTFYIYFKEMQ